MKRLALTLALLCQVAAAQPAPDDGFDWVTIGDAGNRSATEAEQPQSYGAFPGLGSVNHEFRITRSPLTATQWVEFVTAYAPFWDGFFGSHSHTGFSIYPRPLTGGGYEFVPYPGEDQAVNGVTWHLSAAMCNWLHNGKVNEPWALQTGAYDLSDFTAANQLDWIPPLERQPGARFWIPSIDEFVKAAYYDPDRYGPGQEGYWLYPDRGNDPLIEAFPEDGGETIGWRATGTDWSGGLWPVGQYPHVRSHYGLLDVSGTRQQWTETPVEGAHASVRATGGSRSGVFGIWSFDRIDTFWRSTASSTADGLRLATVIPNPSSIIVFAFTLTYIRRRRNDETIHFDTHCRGGPSGRPRPDTVHVLPT